MKQNKNYQNMNDQEIIYAYTRNGVEYVTPSLGLADKRITEGEITIIYNSDDQRASS
jgi:hypothetical protein